jgi:hypothetical protein
MSAAFLRRFVSVAAIASLLIGCAHRPEHVVVDSEQGPVIVADARPKSRILQFCEDYEMVCILGGIAAFAGAALLIKGASPD